MAQHLQTAAKTAVSRDNGSRAETNGFAIGRNLNMWKEVTLSWSIVVMMFAGMFVGSFVSTGAADQPAVAATTSTQHYVHRQTSAMLQDPSDRYTVYVRAIAPRAGR